MFSNLHSAHKFVLTICYTQVTYERTFLKLKILKNRIRSLLHDSYLVLLLLMFMERDLFVYRYCDKNKVLMESLKLPSN